MMTVIIPMLVLYWFITSLIALGIFYSTNPEDDHLGYVLVSGLIAFLGGWIFVPLIIGRALEFTREVKENTIKKDKALLNEDGLSNEL